jgi:two-component system, OmpR family, response regulator
MAALLHKNLSSSRLGTSTRLKGAGHPADKYGRRILLVEDRLQSRKNIAYFLRTEGYEVNEASSGKEAIEILEKDEFDLVLADVVMPELNGLSLLRHLRSIAPEILVVLMSGHSLDPQQILKEGATDFITKPLKLDELLSKVRLALER